MAARADTHGAAVIAGLGMVASLGLDVATVCAAARAGLIRSRTLENYRMRSAVEGAEETVIGHQVTLLTRGFEGKARQIRLAQGALTDLLHQTRHIDWRSNEHRFYVAFPHPGRLGQAANSQTPNSSLADGILKRAAELARWPAPTTIEFSTSAGNVAALEAIQAAMTDLAAGVTRIAIIVAVDSLLDEPTLNWLHTCGRLKCDAAPSGLRPGEAAVALVLSSTPTELPTARPARITAVSFADEERSLLSGKPVHGEGLAKVVGNLRVDSEGSSVWMLSDQNGEIYRATDWGFAVVRLRARDSAFASPVLWYPAASMGDTGIASPLVGVCMAVRAWERGYAPADCALVVACNDDGRRGALALNNTGSSQ
jgi:3-oxoacyl-[acyl-carrier-protein] synthase-1